MHRGRPSTLKSSLIKAICALAFSGCSGSDLGVLNGAGLQQSDTFNGIAGVTLLSPTSVKVTWNTASSYSNYQVFTTQSSVPLGTTVFSSFIVTGLTPNSPYTFSVAGISKASGNSIGLDKQKSITTWPNFTGIQTLTAPSSSNLSVAWTYPVQGPTFNVYVAAGSPPTDFSRPAQSTTAFSAGISQLADGSPILPNTTYYAIVRATYLDQTQEFNNNALNVKTPSRIALLPNIKTDPVILGYWPSIEVSGGLPSYRTAFSINSTSLGSINGNGTYRVPSNLAIPDGSNEINVTVTSGADTAELDPVAVVGRGVKADRPIEYPSFSNGKGAQRIGYQNNTVSGDFNCDGYMDLAVGASSGTFNPLPTISSLSDGGVYIYYGSPTGLIYNPAPSVSPLNPTDPLLLLRPTIGTISSSSNQFGWALATGNLNADTYSSKNCDDLAISTSPTNSNGGQGEVWVFFGSPNGLQQGTPAVNSGACSGSVCSPLVIYPPTGSFSSTSNIYFGFSIWIGNLHRGSPANAYKDLVIGAPGEFLASTFNGSAWIYYGGAQGIDFVSPPTGTPGIPYTRIQGPSSTLLSAGYLNFGISVTSSDIDKDGIDDLIVGAPMDPNGGTNRGSVYVYGSKTNGSATPGEFGFAPSYTNVKLTNPAYPTQNGNLFGGLVAGVGDLNKDGSGDFVISDGYLTQSTSGNYNNGRGLTVYYGSASGVQTGNGCLSVGTVALTGSTCLINQPNYDSCTAGVCKILNIPYVSSGASPTMSIRPTIAGMNPRGAQDLNGDTYPDIVTGWRMQNGLTTVRTFYGGANGLNVNYSTLKPITSITGDGLGSSIAVGNFNGDGSPDLAITASEDLILGNGPHGGALYVFNGQPGGLPSGTSTYSQLILDNLSKEYAYTTVLVTPAGDLNGDGYGDVVARVHRIRTVTLASDYPTPIQGDVIIYFGSPNGLISSPAPSYSPLQPTDPTLLYTGDGGAHPTFGMMAAAGDTNHDGFDDLVVTKEYTGSWGRDIRYADVVVYFGSSSGLQMTTQPLPPPASGLDPLIVIRHRGLANENLWNFHPYTSNYNSSWSNASLTAGDFNADGYSDFALACSRCKPGFDDNSGFTTGYAVVVYGSAQGPQSDGWLTPGSPYPTTPSASLALENPCNSSSGVCLPQLLVGNAGATTEYFGDSIASVGDVNGDGYDDLLVGAPRNPTAGTDNGGAYLFYGSNQGLMLWNGGATGMLIAPPTTSLDAGGNSSNTLQTQRYSGGLVAAAGDVNGDGYRDILIASRYDKTFGTSPSAWGGAFLYYGCGNGLNGSAVTCSNGSGIWGVPSVGGLTDSPVRNIDSCDPSNNHCQPLLFIPKGHTSLSGSTSFYNWGDSVGTVGDLNRSGHSEIAMGAAIVDSLCTSPSCPRSVIRTGGAVVFSGSPKGLSVTANVSRNPICVDKVCTPFYLTPSTSSWGDSSGNGQPAYFNLSIQGPWVDVKHQDFNGDGYPDFIIPFLSYISRDQKTAGMGGFYVFQ